MKLVVQKNQPTKKTVQYTFNIEHFLKTHQQSTNMFFMWYSLSKKSLLQFCWMKFDYFKIQMATAQMTILVEWTWRSLIFNNGSM